MRKSRLWMAFGLFGLTFLALLAGTGAALADQEPGALHGTYQVQPSRPGDRAVYSIGLIIQFPALFDGLQNVPGYDGPRGDQGLYVDGDARMVLERGADRLFPTADGKLAPTASFITTWSTQDFDYSSGYGFGALAALGSGRIQGEPWKVVHAVGGKVVAVTLAADGAPGDLPGRSIASDIGASDNGTVTLFESSPGPCGFHSDLQERAVKLSKKVHIDGLCPPGAGLSDSSLQTPRDGVDVLASGHDDVDGRPTMVFADPNNAERLRLWFAPDTPYPVRILTKMADIGGQIKVHLLYQLVSFQPGQDAEPAGPALQPLEAPRDVWGPAEDKTPHPFPLSAAWQAAKDHGDLNAFLSAHPDAQADSARFVHWTSGDATEERWTFVANGGGEAKEYRVAQRTAPPTSNAGTGPLPPLPLPPPVSQPVQPQTTFVVSSKSVAMDDRLSPAAMPRDLPAVPALLQRWQATRATGADPSSWAFALAGGQSESWSAAGHADSINGTLSYSFLGLRPSGAPLFLEETDGPYHPPQDQKPDSYGPGYHPDMGAGWHDPRTFSAAGVGVWTFPKPETTAAVSIGASLVGLAVYVLWPALKASPLGAVGLFSRIGPDEVLDHPLRAQIVSLVEAEPGLHFQELARRLETGRGTLEHHLRKLVDANLLVPQQSRGFTCYFPKGKLDRHLMAAAPVLKSDGARQVLQAIMAEPNRAAQDIAGATGFTPSTVNYHLKRLVAANLVMSQRVGRFTLLSPTPLGQQALSQWSGT